MNPGKQLGMFAAFVFLTGAVVFAQVTASITGTVKDSSGAVVPGATVTAKHLESGLTRTAETDVNGSYVVPSLPVGQFEVDAEKAGFKQQVRRGMNLVLGQQAIVNLTLEVGSVEQQVTVTAEAPLVNTTTASVSGLVGEKQVKDLPLNGRSFDNLIALNAGTVNFTPMKGAPSGFTAAGNLFSVAGRRPAENLFLLNGVEYTGPIKNTSLPGGVSGQLLGIDAVREFNVVSDTYSAEYGKRPGGQVSIVTQSGTNQLHGTLFEFLRNSDLDARNFFDHGTIPPFKRNQFGGSAGGPIQKDRTFVFGNYEGFRQRLGISDVTVVPDNNARQGLLPNAQGVPTAVPGLDPASLKYMALWPAPNGPTLGGGLALAYSNPPQTIREDFGTARVDHTFSGKDSLSAAYTVSDGYNLTPNADPVFGTIQTLRNQILSLQETHIFSPNVINVFTAGLSHPGYNYSNIPIVSVPADLSFVQGRPPGQFTVGGGSGGTGNAIGSITTAGSSSAVYLDQKSLFTYADAIQVIKGRHQISAGAGFERLRSNETGVPSIYGGATFASLQSLLQGITSNFQVVENPIPHAWRQWQGAWYLQDAIQVRPNLTVRLGLRHEFTNGWNEATGRSSNFLYDANGVMLTNPLVGDSALTQNNAKLLFGPRIGLAWDPFGKGKTSIRTGFGTHYDIQDYLSHLLGPNPPYNGNVTFQNVSLSSFLPIIPTTPVPPVCGPGVPQPCTTYSPTGVEPTMKIPTIEEWNFTIEQQITSNTSLRLAYVGSRGFHEEVGVDPNAIHSQICSNASGCVSGGVNRTLGFVPQGAPYIPVGTRPNPYLASGNFWFYEGNSNYNALQAEVTKRFSRGLQFRANYTWAKAMDTIGSNGTSDQQNAPQLLLNPYDIRSSWGPSAYDFRQQASISGSYELPLGQGKPWLKGSSGAAGKLAGGWKVNWIVNLLSGLPLTPNVGSNQSGDGDTRIPDRPSLNPAFSGPVILGTPNRWFNPNAYILPVSGTYGNAGKGVLRGPGLGALDLSLFKDTMLTERLRLEFRAELFNILNRANFGIPNATVFSGGAISSSAGLVTNTTTTSRQTQFGMKLIF